ncbi:MAG: topoisomerase DNA-binding C4 zinc finger domain-containing protein [Candidatus Levybacteria bacterium]|nr:topoisomerase DNA-binding C4 zinc finger domain-containing protein [Candidatus Levybacteria bacterium]
MSEEKNTAEEVCPKCGKAMGEITITKTGRKLQRCSTGAWDPETKKNTGCEYVKWFEVEPEALDEDCPKCGSKLIMATTRFGKKMKKCSAGSWDKATKKAVGCDFVEWVNGTTEKLDEDCPECGKKLVLFTTNAGKKMKKCSTAGWDSANKKATGCTYVYWLKFNEYPQTADSGGEEFLPPEPEN